MCQAMIQEQPEASPQALSPSNQGSIFRLNSPPFVFDARCLFDTPAVVATLTSHLASRGQDPRSDGWLDGCPAESSRGQQQEASQHLCHQQNAMETLTCTSTENPAVLRLLLPIWSHGLRLIYFANLSVWYKVISAELCPCPDRSFPPWAASYVLNQE